MFSIEEKRRIAKAIEDIITEIHHPEMPDTKPIFILHVEGKESWSFADIEPNWVYEDKSPITTEWNENARKYMEGR